MDELIRYMRAMVMLQLHTAQAMADRGEGPPLKPEALLASAGIPTKEIAAMLGKSPEAVAKAISRARATRKSGDAAPASPSTPRSGDVNDA